MHTNHRMRLTVWAVALLVLITGMSCSLVSGGRKEQPEAAPNQPEETFPAHYPTTEGTLDIDLGLQQLTSYRGRLLIDFKADGSPAGQRDAYVDLLIAVDRAANAFHEDSRLLADPGWSPAGVTLYEIGTLEYMVTFSDMNFSEQTGCMVQEIVPSPNAVHGGFSNYLREIRKGQRLGSGEMISGVLTDRYEVTGATFAEAENAQVSGEMWVAQDGGYIVKAEGQAEANLISGEKLHGKAQWSFLLEGINATTISLPPLCQQVNSPQDTVFPLTADAQNFSASGDSYAFTSQLSAETVADFYRAELPPLGWSIEEQGGSDGMYMWMVTGQGSTYILSITQSNDMTVVNVSRLR